MRLKFYPGDLRRAARLVSADGEILVEFGVDPEFGMIKLYVDADGTQKAEILLDLAVGSPATVVDADEKSVRALPSPCPPLPSQIDFDGFDFLEGDYFHDDEQEQEDEDED